MDRSALESVTGFDERRVPEFWASRRRSRNNIHDGITSVRPTIQELQKRGRFHSTYSVLFAGNMLDPRIDLPASVETLNHLPNRSLIVEESQPRLAHVPDELDTTNFLHGKASIAGRNKGKSSFETQKQALIELIRQMS